MKHSAYLILTIGFLFFYSCSSEQTAPIETEAEKFVPPANYLPFTKIDLSDLSAFDSTGDNWRVVGDITSDRTKEKTMFAEEGTGILYNANDQEKNKNIQTAFDHGDIEIEFDVMMPLKSNAGIYFQGRYEIQLLDSWGVENPKHKDMGGVYQRWNSNAQKGKEGYEGIAPRVNAAKAPGLWQHFKIIFHAPKFNANGKKIKNAWFEKVWLNGVLIHENVFLSGPTRGGMAKESARGKLLIQGDHGPVALKNIKYKLYEDNKIRLSNLVRTTYDSEYIESQNIDTLPFISKQKETRFSLVDITSTKAKKLLTYTGNISIPKSGKYLFEGITKGIGEIFIDGKKILRMQDAKNYPIKTVQLEKGTFPFKLIYRQLRPWQRGFALYVEGPEMQSYSLQDGVRKGANDFDVLKGIIIEPENEVVTQRSYVAHKGEKRTHCISVGTPEGIHYSYDLATGSLLKAWTGSFLNTTHMWLSRGFEQLGEPIGFGIALHGGLEFAELKNEEAVWPRPLAENKSTKQLGYTFDSNGMPSFSYQIGKSTITNTFSVSDNKNRALKKSITISSRKKLWHKIAEGEDIKSIENDVYIINNESFYIDFSGNDDLNPIIRKTGDKEELIVEISRRKKNVSYSIIW